MLGWGNTAAQNWLIPARSDAARASRSHASPVAHGGGWRGGIYLPADMVCQFRVRHAPTGPGRGRSRSFRAVAAPASARSRHSLSLAIETFVSRPPVPAAHRATIVRRPPSCAERKSALQPYHRRPSGAFASFGGALWRPFGPASFNIRHV